MKRAALVVATLAAVSGTASAGTYLGLGIGPSPTVSDDKDRLDAVGRSGKVLLGFGMGRLSIEGSIGRNDMTLADQMGRAIPYGHLWQASASGKLNFPLGDRFEAFGRAGLIHMRVDAADRPEDRRDALRISGNGFLIGGGFEYRLNLGVGGGSIFLDYTIANADLSSDLSQQLQFDTTTRIWTLGLTIGL
jgi:opacity protein-like surface antigen